MTSLLMGKFPRSLALNPTQGARRGAGTCSLADQSEVIAAVPAQNVTRAGAVRSCIYKYLEIFVEHCGRFYFSKTITTVTLTLQVLHCDLAPPQ